MSRWPLILPRLVYPYSVVPGGIGSVVEARLAMDRDPVVARHYQDLHLEKAVMVTVAEDKSAHVSYRIKDSIYWTRKKIRLAKGEQLLTDGTTVVRARCGNRVSDTPGTTSALLEPPDGALNTPELPEGPYALLSGPQEPGPYTGVTGSPLVGSIPPLDLLPPELIGPLTPSKPELGGVPFVPIFGPPGGFAPGPVASTPVVVPSDGTEQAPGAVPSPAPDMSVIPVGPSRTRTTPGLRRPGLTRSETLLATPPDREVVLIDEGNGPRQEARGGSRPPTESLPDTPTGGGSGGGGNPPEVPPGGGAGGGGGDLPDTPPGGGGGGGGGSPDNPGSPPEPASIPEPAAGLLILGGLGLLAALKSRQ